MKGVMIQIHVEEIKLYFEVFYSKYKKKTFSIFENTQRYDLKT
jgi:hypothetical protein